MKKATLVILSILFSCCAIAQGVVHKRTVPTVVPQVAYGPMLLTAPANKMGYIVANDSSGNELWTAQIYKVHYDANMDKDVQGIYITNISLRGDDLLIRDEDDRHYILDLKTKKVVSLTE